MIAAILRAQWLCMRIAPSGRAALNLIPRVIWYSIWTVAASVVGYFASIATPGALRLNLPLGFLGVCFYWQMMPVLSASMGRSLDMRKLLAYPLPHGKLLLVEALLRLTNGGEMLLVLTGGTIGLLANAAFGGWLAVPRVIAAIVVLVVFNVLLGSGMRSVIERLLTRRIVREVAAVVMACVWVLPRLVMQLHFHPKWLGPAADVLRGVALPWSAASSAILGDSQLLAWIFLGGWTLGALWFGRAQFERSLRYDASAAQATKLRPAAIRAKAPAERFYRFPSLLFRDPLATIVEKELRSLARTPRFRSIFVMGCTYGLLIWLPIFISSGHGARPGGYFLMLGCSYSLLMLGQVTFWNCFGFDRSAAVFYFASPRTLASAFIGKNIATLFYIYLQVSILSGIMFALRLLSGWASVMETFAAAGICFLFLAAMGNIVSVRSARGMNPERVGQSGAAGGAQGWILLMFPLAMLPIAFAYLARYAFDSQAAFVCVLAVSAIGGAVAYRAALQSAVTTATTNREGIMQALSKGDGPIAAD